MDKELIERLAREAGMPVMPLQAGQTVFYISLEQQVAFAALIAEECAKMAEPVPLTFEAAQMGIQQHDPAAAIRERFKP